MIRVTNNFEKVGETGDSLEERPCDRRPFSATFCARFATKEVAFLAFRHGLEIASGRCKFIPVEPEKEFSSAFLSFSPSRSFWRFPRRHFSWFYFFSPFPGRHILSGKSNYTLLGLIPGGERQERESAHTNLST